MLEPNDHAELSASLNGETAKLHWQELQPHYARGVVIRVAGNLDLVEVALRLTLDDKPAFESWLRTGAVSHIDVEQAQAWAVRDAQLWAVVVAPWILVQEKRIGSDLN